MSEILESVLEEFKNLAAIPRPSKHEERVSNFLKKYLQSYGITVAQDENNNIIAEIPGKKGTPLTILQAHMDMVCVAEEGYDYNPLTDSIKLIRTENFLEAEGTSLGADDGIGIAEILYIAKNADKFPHGPIRIIFTTDEEQGMSGATNIDKKYFADAAYLINCDSENYNELVVGSAGSLHVDFSRRINSVKPKFHKAFRIKISGFPGGHSGIEIHQNRTNAIKFMNDYLRLINGKGDFQLAKFSGGKAPNVIPDAAEVVIVADFDLAKDDNPRLNISAVPMPDRVLSDEDFDSLKNLLAKIHSGVYSAANGVPVTSANIGIIRVDENIYVNVLARSNISELIDDFIKNFAQDAEATGFQSNFGDPTPAWNYKSESRLAEIMTKIFYEQNNFPPKVHTIHAGLECSFFIAKNPALDVVSIGTTNEFIHSPKERLHLKTVEPQVKLIIETLKQIAK